MTVETTQATDWPSLWRTGVLPRFCFVSLGITFHAGAENMISTIMPSMVRDIGGIEMAGWSFAIYEIGSIVAGAVTGRLTTFWTVRTNMLIAALIFAIGAAITGLAPTMPVALGGRLVSGFGGGALIALSMVAIQRYFPSAIWPQLMAILSVVWGVTAFGGPLFGGLAVQYLNWRSGFLIFAGLAVIFGVACLAVLRHEAPPRADRRSIGLFPFGALLVLAAGISLVATAGLERHPLLAAVFIAAGVAGILGFFVLDSRNASARLFPSRALDPRTVLGSGMLMVATLSISTVSFLFYGPLLLAALHELSPVTTGLLIAAESVAWSVMSIVIANAPRHREALIIRLGALMIVGGLAGFAWAIPAGSLPGILVFAFMQGGGFGMAWPFVNRCVVEAAPVGEKEITAAAFSTLQRMGYATGGAFAGIIANANGFAEGFTRQTAATAAQPLYLSFVPLALIGVFFAFRMSGLAARNLAASAPR
ncbi:MAG: MFS transporter [Hyphomicrobiaceae bacterium]